jgi:non-ribosomal peptide synthetase component F
VSAECLPAMVEAQAARTPEAIALRGADQAMTYGEMDRRANLIAERLRPALRPSVGGTWPR